LNRIRQQQSRREDYIGPWLPEPVSTERGPAESVEMAESVSMAMLVVLETLSPLERAVFVLREVFAFDYEEIGSAVEGLKTKVEEMKPPRDEKFGGASDDIGDIAWNVPTVYLWYPANIPKLPGHSWENAVAMATPIAHKGSTAGAKVQVATALDLLLVPELRDQAWAYFRDVQTRDQKYVPLMSPDDVAAVEMNREKMARFLPGLRKLYYDPARYRTYLEQLGITYPTVR